MLPMNDLAKMIWRMAICTKGQALTLTTALMTCLLVACGGGCGNCRASASASTDTSTEAIAVAQNRISSASLSTQQTVSAIYPLPSRQEATRFLTQATFGPTPADVSHLMQVGFETWLDEQFAAPMSTTSHLNSWDASNKAIKAINTQSNASRGEVVSSVWRQAMTSKDQLRQRVALALSEIFVISVRDSCGDNGYSRGAADFIDLLGRRAFGTYRTLIESVALHPVMGCYLSHIKNLPDDAKTGRVPDENFARELMQLFSIGLYELNMDGSVKLDASRQPIETYTQADITGLAKIFTGWSWWCSWGLNKTCYFSDPNSPEQYVTPMQGYALYHSSADKHFLSHTVSGGLFSTPENSVKQALDIIATHPNVGPFIGKQLIQRLVTSNPSPAYVSRIAQTFNASGGNLQATVRAILLDPQARADRRSDTSNFGKVREPILRLTALMRAVGAHSDSGFWLLTDTTDPSVTLGQSPLSSPSVFNFFRPGFMRPGSISGQLGLVAPELQLSNEVSAAGYVNFMTRFMWCGAGTRGYNNLATRQDVQLNATIDAADPLLALTDRPTAFVEEINQRLLWGTMSSQLKGELIDTVTSITLGPNPNQTDILNTRRERLWSTLLLTAVSPEFQVQR
jgi:uncharacterized protein (DUF1800 family)